MKHKQIYRLDAGEPPLQLSPARKGAIASPPARGRGLRGGLGLNPGRLRNASPDSATLHPGYLFGSGFAGLGLRDCQ